MGEFGSGLPDEETESELALAKVPCQAAGVVSAGELAFVVLEAEVVFAGDIELEVLWQILHGEWRGNRQWLISVQCESQSASVTSSACQLEHLHPKLRPNAPNSDDIFVPPASHVVQHELSYPEVASHRP